MKPYNIRKFNSCDLSAIIPLWNSSVRNRSFLYPLTSRKIQRVFFQRPSFDLQNFFLLETTMGIEAGIAMEINGEDGMLLAWFTRGGKPNRYLQTLLQYATEVLAERGATRFLTDRHARVNAKDVATQQFFFHNRFHVPCSHDPVLDRHVARIGLMLGRNIRNLQISADVIARQQKLKEAGYSFFWYDKNTAKQIRRFAAKLPFRDAFRRVAHACSSLEHLYVAVHNGIIVGGALVSEPFAPTDWPLHGCDCGLFGPTGVVPEHRGGIGTVLLLHTLCRLRERGFTYVVIPTTPSVFQFYEAKAGFNVIHTYLTLVKEIDDANVQRYLMRKKQ